MTQHEQVIRHIKRTGSISSFEAIMDYGITRLAARIWELTNKGYKFRVERKVNPATKKQYARYFLEEEDA